MTDKTDI